MKETAYVPLSTRIRMLIAERGQSLSPDSARRARELADAAESTEAIENGNPLISARVAVIRAEIVGKATEIFGVRP